MGKDDEIRGGSDGGWHQPEFDFDDSDVAMQSDADLAAWATEVVAAQRDVLRGLSS